MRGRARAGKSPRSRRGRERDGWSACLSTLQRRCRPQVADFGIAEPFAPARNAGAFVVLMLASGQALEAYAVGRASSVLDALARRVPSVAHRRRGSALDDVQLDDIEAHDLLVVLPHEICPVDGVVVEGHGVMDES